MHSRLILIGLLGLVTTACTDDGGSDDGNTGETGDGDGDPTGDGDGDGDPGDGDGDPGDGDGDPTGDGDGDPTGDGDGDPTGDGDGDGDGDPVLPPDFLDQLTSVGGCGDVYIGATNPAGTMAILFDGAPLVETAYMLGEAQVRESTLPSADVGLRIALGTYLGDGCNDVGEGPNITTEWIASGGTVTLTVVPTGIPQPWEMPADATLELTNVTFENAGLDPVVVESWIVTDVYVGWLPG